MPPRNQNDGGNRNKVGRTFSQLFGRSRSRVPPPSSAPVNTPPPVPPPTVPPSVQPAVPTRITAPPTSTPSIAPSVSSSQPTLAVPTPVPETVPTVAAQPPTSFHDTVSDSSEPAGPSSVVSGKVDVNIAAQGSSPVSPGSPPTSAPTPPVVRRPPEDIRWKADFYKEQGNRSCHSGEFRQAVDEYSRALELWPSNAEYLANRSYAYYSLLRYRDAIEDAKASVAAKPTYSTGWSRLGAVHKALGEYDDAKAAYTRALEFEKSPRVADTITRNLEQVTNLSKKSYTTPTSLPQSTTSVPSMATRASTTLNTSSPRPPSTPVPPRPASSANTPMPWAHLLEGNWAAPVGFSSGATRASTTPNTSSPRPPLIPRPASSIPIPVLSIPVATTASTTPNTSSPRRPLTPVPPRPISSAPIPDRSTRAISSTGSAFPPLVPGLPNPSNAPCMQTSSTNSLPASVRPPTGTNPRTSPPSSLANTQAALPSSQRLTTVSQGSSASVTPMQTATCSPITPTPPTPPQSVPTASQVSPLPQRSTTVSQPSISITPAQTVTHSPIVPTPSTSSACPTASVNASSEADIRKAEHHKALGNEAFTCQDFEKAIDQYTRAIQLDPSSAVYLSNRSCAYLALSKFQDARIDAEKAVVADPEYWKGWARLGSAHKALEQYSDAKVAFERGLEVLGPGSGGEVTRRNLAEVTRILDGNNYISSVLTPRPAAVTTNNPPQSAPTPIPLRTTTSSPAAPRPPVLPPPIPSRLAPSSPTSASTRSVLVNATQESVARSPTTQPPAMAADLPADSPPSYRPGGITAAATTTNNPSSRVPTHVPPRPTISLSDVAHPPSSTPTPPRPVEPSPAPAPSPATQQPAIATDLSADLPPAYRPGEITSADPIIAAVAEQELELELDGLERKIAARNTGALSFGHVSLNGHVSFFVSLTGRESQYLWDKDLDLVKIAHPAFALYHIGELKGSTLHQVDPEMDRKFAGLIPGTVSMTGYSGLISEHIRTTTRQTTVILSSHGPLPVLPGRQLVARIDRLRIGLEFTDHAAYSALRQLLGPDQTMWINQADRFKLSNQIKDICMALNRRDIFKDFRDATSISHLLHASPPVGMGMWDFVLQIVLGYELYLRLKKDDGGSWYSGINDRVSATMLISKLWVDNVDMTTEDDGYVSNSKFRSRVQARQIEGLLRFAELMKWPHLSEMRDFVENAYVDLLGGKQVKVDVWDWLFGLILPGWYFSWKIMSVLVMATPSLSHSGTMQFNNSGFNLGDISWWRSRVVLGSVLAGIRGVKSVCGWIGPCPGVTAPPERPWIRIRSRPVEFDPLRNMDDTASTNESDEDEGHETSRSLFVPREGETLFDLIQDLSDMSRWSEPVLPPKVNLTCSVHKISLRALPHETTGIIDRNDPRTEYQASIVFRLANTTGFTEAIYTLYTNPTFISAHPCIGTHVVHRREMSYYTDHVVAVKDLKHYETDGGSRKVLVINAQCDGGEAVARAWCAEKGRHAVVRRAKGTCFVCSVSMARELSVGVLIWS